MINRYVWRDSLLRWAYIRRWSGHQKDSWENCMGNRSGRKKELNQHAPRVLIYHSALFIALFVKCLNSRVRLNIFFLSGHQQFSLWQASILNPCRVCVQGSVDCGATPTQALEESLIKSASQVRTCCAQKLSYVSWHSAAFLNSIMVFAGCKDFKPLLPGELCCIILFPSGQFHASCWYLAHQYTIKCRWKNRNMQFWLKLTAWFYKDPKFQCN